MTSRPDIKGARIFIIEDDVLLGATIEDMLVELGCEVAGRAVSLEGAYAAIEDVSEIDCVMLDVRLGNDLSSEIATRLFNNKVPFIVCSGYQIRCPDLNVPVVDKPFTVEVLADALARAM